MSDLDKDFEETIVKVNEKLKEAAEALKEATKLAKKVGYKNGLILSQWSQEAEGFDWRKPDADEWHDKLEKKYALIKVHALEAAMGGAGWSASSSYC